MIAKHVFKSKKHKDRSGCTSLADCTRLIAYAQRESAHGQTLWNDFASDRPTDIADEVQMMRRRKGKYWMYHIEFAFPPEEAALWKGREREMIADFQARFGVSHGFWASHEDKEHYHIHGAILALRPNGGQLRLGSINAHGEAVPVAMALRQFAQDWEDRTPGARKTGRSGELGISISKDALEAAQRQGDPVPLKLRLRADVQNLVILSSSFATLVENAAAYGIEVRYRRDDTGKVRGVSFSRGGVSLRGREAGYTYRQLQSLYENTNTVYPSTNREPTNLGAPYRGFAPPRTPPTNRPFGTHPDGTTYTGRGHDGCTRCIEDALRCLEHPFPVLHLFLYALAVLTLKSTPYQHRPNRPAIPL